MKEFVTQQLVTSEIQLSALKQFLEANQLPHEDLTLTNSLFLVYYNSDEKIVGSGGLEFRSNLALLRSLAVSQGLRGQFLGKQIVADLLTEVQKRKLEKIYLLTQTARYFFTKFGFEVVDRINVPEEIKSTTEFSEVCPTSAIVMELVLNTASTS